MATQKKKSPVKKKSGSSKSGWIKAFLIALILILLVKAFITEPFVVKSSNMGNTLLPGEIVLINKLSIGARLPVTVLSMPFFGFTHYSDIIQVPVKRMPPIDSIQRFDLIQFNAPYEFEKPIDKRTLLVSRVIGLPGEKVEIANYRCKIDDQSNDMSNLSLSFRYSLIMESESVFEKISQKFNIAEGSAAGKNKSIISCTTDQAKIIGLEEGVKKIALIDDYSDDQELIFASGQNRKWNKKNFGPVNIPSKGEKLKLNLTNIDIYFDLIRYHENNELSVIDSEIIINGLKTNEYIVKDNYYLVLDDNRSDSKDSRYWGFLPENHVIGKSRFIIFSLSNQGFISNLKRFFKKAN